MNGREGLRILTKRLDVKEWTWSSYINYRVQCLAARGVEKTLRRSTSYCLVPSA